MSHVFVTGIVFAAVAGATVPLLGQSQPEQELTAFEVASVKPNSSSDAGIRQRWTRTQYRAGNASLFFFITQAFGRSQEDEIIGAPAWSKTEKWDIVGEAPTPGPPMPRLRKLLEERFKLVTHVETRTLPVYELILARTDRRLGPQMRESTDAGRFQQLPGRFTARATRVGILVITLAWAAHGRVVDQTGLTGQYDIDLRWSVESPSGDGSPQSPDAPSIFTAVQEQLGLKLQPTKTPVDVLVIDHVERPTTD